MEDRIYRSLRTAQERELHNHAVPAEPAAAQASAAAPAAPEHAAPPTHVAAPAHAAAPAHVSAPPHAHVQPVDAAGPRWFTRGLGGERPRISVVGTLSLSVLISAGLFAAQRIFNPPQKHHDDIVAADSSASLRLAPARPMTRTTTARPPCPCRGTPKCSCSGRARTLPLGSRRRIGRPVLRREPLERRHRSASAAKSHHHASRAVQHATDEADSLPADLDGTAQTADRSSHAPLDPMSSSPENASPVSQAQRAAAVTADQSVRGAAGVPGRETGNAGQRSDDGCEQSAVACPPAPPSTVQISAEAANANTPTLTIVPGRPENFAMSGGSHAPVMQPIAQAAPVAPQPLPPQQVVPQQVVPQQVVPQVVAAGFADHRPTDCRAADGFADSADVSAGAG